MISAAACDALSFASTSASPLSFLIDLFVHSSAPRCEDDGGGTLPLAAAASSLFCIRFSGMRGGGGEPETRECLFGPPPLPPPSEEDDGGEGEQFCRWRMPTPLPSCFCCCCCCWPHCFIFETRYAPPRKQVAGDLPTSGEQVQYGLHFANTLWLNIRD